MGIHYTYKSIRGEKAMKKEAKRKARLEERRAKRISRTKNQEPEKKMHDIIQRNKNFNSHVINIKFKIVCSSFRLAH